MTLKEPKPKTIHKPIGAVIEAGKRNILYLLVFSCHYLYQLTNEIPSLVRLANQTNVILPSEATCIAFVSLLALSSTDSRLSNPSTSASGVKPHAVPVFMSWQREQLTEQLQQVRSLALHDVNVTFTWLVIPWSRYGWGEPRGWPVGSVYPTLFLLITQHTQLLTQLYLMCREEPTLQGEAAQCRKYVNELDGFSDRASNANLIRALGDGKVESSAFCFPGLSEALRWVWSLGVFLRGIFFPVLNTCPTSTGLAHFSVHELQERGGTP